VSDSLWNSTPPSAFDDAARTMWMQEVSGAYSAGPLRFSIGDLFFGIEGAAVEVSLPLTPTAATPSRRLREQRGRCALPPCR
jgi:hypothetical protein